MFYGTPRGCRTRSVGVVNAAAAAAAETTSEDKIMVDKAAEA